MTTQTKKGQERPEMVVTTHKTPNGYAVVVNQRFDTRALLARFTNVELKKRRPFVLQVGDKIVLQVGDKIITRL